MLHIFNACVYVDHIQLQYFLCVDYPLHPVVITVCVDRVFMEDNCIAEAQLSSSSNPSCDDRVAGKSSVITKVASTRMADASRPTDPRDFRKSRAYYIKNLDQNAAFQLNQKNSQEKPALNLDRSILTPITDVDEFDEIKVTNSNVEFDVIVSEEAVVDLTIGNNVDICIPESTDMVLGENLTEESRKEDKVVIVVDDSMKAEEKRKTHDVVIVVEKEKEDNVEKDNKLDKLENNITKEKEDVMMVVDDEMEVEEGKQMTDVPAEENRLEVDITKEKVEGEKEYDKHKMEVDKMVVKEKDDKMEVDRVEIKEIDDKMEVELLIEEPAKMEDHMDVTTTTATTTTNTITTINTTSSTTTTTTTTTSSIGRTKLSVPNSSAVSNLALTVTNTQVKSKPFRFNPEPIDDDLSLPSSNELSNQVLSNNFLRDIENLSDYVEAQLPNSPSMNRILNKPLIPSCSAFRSSVLSNVTSTVKSGSSLSTSGKQNTNTVRT